jgi:hypothetical protein
MRNKILIGFIVLIVSGVIFACSIFQLTDSDNETLSDALGEVPESLVEEEELPVEDLSGDELPVAEQPVEEPPVENIADEEQPPQGLPVQLEEESATLDQLTLIIGMAWRLFEASDPAGVAAADVILSINGVDQPAVRTRIDGLYLIEVEGIQPGDVLQLRAQAPQDDFEPLYYEWQAELGVNRWEYDFYSYWDEITPPSSQNQNRIFGTVWDQFEGDVSGLYLNLQMGTSDAIQRMGPTDEDGYFEAMVTLPDRIMVTVWVDAEGYVPSKLMFFHPYKPEDRELIFWKYYGENLQ